MRQIYMCVLLLLVLVLGGTLVYREYRHRQEWKKVQNASIILISKQDMRLRLIDYKGQELFSAPVATGRNPGNKQKQGDMK